MSIESRSQQYGKVFNHWQIREYLGGGSGGKTAVFRLVHSTSIDPTESALKVINLIEKKGNYETLSDSQKAEYSRICRKYSEKAEREVIVMKEFQGNSFIVDYLDHTFEEWADETGYGCDMLIRMEKLTDLRKEMEHKGCFSETEILKIGINICEALLLCHSRGIYHRDIKPENIFVNKLGGYKLGDFGIAKIMSVIPVSQNSTIAYTPQYAAPEQFRREYDQRTDIYSLGLVLYELCNENRLPFAESEYVTEEDIQRRIGGDKLPKLSNVSSELEQVILKACSPDPNKRYQTAKDFLEALNNMSSGGDKTEKNRKKSSGTYDTEISTKHVKTARKDYSTEPAHGSRKTTNNNTEPVETKTPGKNGPQEPIKLKWLLIAAVAVLATIVAVVGWKHIFEKKEPWENNVMAETIQLDPAISRDSIIAVEFLDTTEGAPDTCWDASAEQNQSVIAWLEKNGGIYYKLVFAGEGGINGKLATRGLFSSFGGLKQIDFGENFHTEEATDMSAMFAYCHSLLSLDIQTLDTSNVTNMDRMFVECWNLYELDLSNFDTEKVESYESFMDEGAFVNNRPWEEIFRTPDIMEETVVATNPIESNNTISQKKYVDLKLGAIIELGRYEQDGDKSNGAEPIEWIVLAEEDNEALIVSVLGLDTLPYEDSRSSVDWENCSARVWLEDTFYENAFTDEEKRSIAEKEIVQHKNKGYPYSDQGNNTIDHVFLLSAEEYIGYLYDNVAIDAQYREGIPSAYVLQKGIDKYEYYKGDRCWWWLRTSSAYNEKACFVAAMGPSEVYVGYPINKLGGMIRPAMWITLSENEENTTYAESLSTQEYTGAISTCDHIFEVLNTSDGIATSCRFCGISQNNLPEDDESFSYSKCEHDYEAILQTNGTPAYECRKCDNIQIMAIASLTNLKKLRDTNADGKNEDVVVGDFREESGKEIDDAVRFWVVDKSGYTNTESIDFYLANSYSSLAGMVFAGDQSEKGANMTLRFYGDERLIAEIADITKGSEYFPEIDVSDVEVLRIECSTEKSSHGYCFIQASVGY